MDLAVGDPLLASRDLRQLAVDLLFLREHPLLDLDDPGAVLRDLAVDLGAKLDRLLARGDLRLSPQRVRFTVGVVDQLLALLLGGAESRLAERADGDGPSQSPCDKADENPDDDLHGLAPGLVARGLLPQCPPGIPAGTRDPESVKRADTAARRAVATSPLPRAFRCRSW